MHLVMFDIDGTLTETVKVDEECFVRSFKDVFGFIDVDTDWSHYPHTTDSGIFHDIFTSRIGRSPTAQEVSRFRQHFIDRKSTRLNSSHQIISYAVFCLKKNISRNYSTD